MNTLCTIKLTKDEHPEKFKLSPDLANLLDTEEDTRAGILMGVWEYSLVNNLQEREDKRMILCDEKMKKVCLKCKIIRLVAETTNKRLIS